MQIDRWLRILAFAASWLAAAPAAAVLWTDPPASFADVVAKADRAYRGRVVALTYGSAGGPAGQQLPYTQVDLRVEAAFKGTSVGALESVYVLGGRFPSPSGRRLLVPGLPSLAVGERAVLFANHASFPFTGAVWGALGMLRVAQPNDGPALALTHAWQPVSISASTIVARPEVRCAVDPKRRDRCTGWFPTSPRPGSPVKPVALPVGVATLAQLEEWVSARVKAGARPAAPSLVKRAQVEALIGAWLNLGGKK